MKQKIKSSISESRLGLIKKWGGLLVLSLALAIIIIDTTLLNVSLGPIIKDLDTNLQGIQWVITLYALVLASFTIFGGRLGDLFGRRKMFILGAIIFAFGSFLASISHGLPLMIAGEAIIEGFGAALMMPATASLLLATFKGRERAIAFGVWGGVAGAASAVGPILGGWLTTTYSWRWGFRINIFVALLVLIGALLFLKESRDTKEKKQLDGIGILLSSTGLFAIVFGIIESATYGWWMAKGVFTLFSTSYPMPFGLSITPVAVILGLTLLAIFVWYERRHEARGKTPLVSIRIFRNWQFSSGLLTLMVMSLSLTGLIFALPVYFQAVRGQDALHTGYSLLPLSISLFIASPFAIMLTKFMTPKRIIQLGLGLTIAGIFLISRGITVDGTTPALLWGLILFGVAMGFVQSQINNLTLSAVSVQQAGEASGISGTARQLGSSFGSAVIGAVVLATLTASLATGITNSSVIPVVAKDKISQAVAAQSSATEFGTSPQLGAGVPVQIVKEIKTITSTAVVDGVKRGLDFALVFAFISFFVALGLPNVKNLESEKGESPVAAH
ncbi:DHA2 family efflux MFS transporter permease subunit [Candidatus Saccharibacteria bacterium]|nr:DHA2 family efflux MFS transporter permease subunit [Candidatus Saccharibacteria bacterium]